MTIERVRRGVASVRVGVASVRVGRREGGGGTENTRRWPAGVRNRSRK